QGKVLGDFPVSAAIEELVAGLGTARDRQSSGVTRSTTRCVFELTCVKGHTVDFLGGDGATFKGLGQQTTVVCYQDRQVRCQSTTHVCLGLGVTRFDVPGQTAPFVHC